MVWFGRSGPREAGKPPPWWLGPQEGHTPLTIPSTVAHAERMKRKKAAAHPFPSPHRQRASSGPPSAQHTPPPQRKISSQGQWAGRKNRAWAAHPFPDYSFQIHRKRGCCGLQAPAALPQGSRLTAAASLTSPCHSHPDGVRCLAFRLVPPPPGLDTPYWCWPWTRGAEHHLCIHEPCANNLVILQTPLFSKRLILL